MENYIVRIYRRHEADPDKVAGTFESVENERKNAFTSLQSLIGLLTSKRSAHIKLDKTNNNHVTQAPEPAPLSD